MIVWRNRSLILNLLLCCHSFRSLATEMEPRIINGQEVEWNSTRYQVSIRLEEIDRYFFGLGHLCGGSIIAHNAILTSAHCIWSANNNNMNSESKFSVVMGNLDRSVNNERSLKLSVSKIIIGEHYNSTTFQDDLAILLLNQSIPETFNGAEIIDLNDNVLIENGINCLVTGWGLTEKQTYSRKLMMIEVPIIDRAICSINYGLEMILDGMLCAGYMSGGMDACSGDSGGPLVCNNKLVGIVSFGVGCALPGYPGIYTNVAYYHDWIRNQIGLSSKHNRIITNTTIDITPNDISGAKNSTNTIIHNYSNILLLFFIFGNIIAAIM